MVSAAARAPRVPRPDQPAGPRPDQPAGPPPDQPPDQTRDQSPDQLPDQPPDQPDLPAPSPVWRRSDPVALALALAVIAVAALVGHELLRRGQVAVLPAPPLVAHWRPHAGWGTPLALICVLVGLRLQRVAATLRWRRLLVSGWLLSLAWLCSLALVDGLAKGWVGVLENPNEYLADLPRITDPVQFLQSFTDHIAFSAGVDGELVWTTHVAGHPPLATLVFWALAALGLPGGFWAGVLCILVGSTAAVSLAVTLRALGAPGAARRSVPLLALFPGGVWMAVSADGLFAGVAVGGLALVCVGAAGGRALVGLVGGLLLGVAVHLSYGLVLFGLVAAAASLLTCRRLGLRHVWRPLLLAAVGVAAVFAAHLVLGFNWFSGLAQLRIRYYQGIASDRPFSYFVYANVAAWLISCSPALAVGIGRAVGAIGRRRAPWSPDRAVALLCLAGVSAAIVADLSALSKAETERIWLSFGIVAYAGVALLRDRAATWTLGGAALWALLVNHLLATGW